MYFDNCKTVPELKAAYLKIKKNKNNIGDIIYECETKYKKLVCCPCMLKGNLCQSCDDFKDSYIYNYRINI